MSNVHLDRGQHPICHQSRGQRVWSWTSIWLRLAIMSGFVWISCFVIDQCFHKSRASAAANYAVAYADALAALGNETDPVRRSELADESREHLRKYVYYIKQI